MNSLGASVVSTSSTAQAAGNGLPVIKHHRRQTSHNKIKLEMPPRPPKTNNRRQKPPTRSSSDAMNANTGGGSVGGIVDAVNAGGAQGGGGGKGDDACVSHVVRVTFLGVAGLLARPSHQNGTMDGPGNEQSPHSITTAAKSATTSPASAEYPSLLFPLPPYLRVVASVSRSRTARGIPSGMSKCLASPTPNGGSSSQPNPPQSVISPLSAASGMLSPLSTAAMAGSFEFSPRAGESIVVKKQHSPPTRESGKNNKMNIDEISIARDPSTGLELFDRDEITISVSSAKKDGSGRTPRHHRRKGSRSRSSISPPSQLLHARTGSTNNRSRASKTSSGGGSMGGSAAGQKDDVPDSTEGIEVIRPCSPSEGLLGGTKKMLGLRGGSLKEEARGDVADTDADEPERYVAVWDEGGSFKPPQPPKTTAQQQQHQFVNLTNSLAFEAELRPSSAEGGRNALVASTTFAPKSFCVSVGLVPAFEYEGESGSRILDDLGEAHAASPTSSVEGSGGTWQLPTFAIPVGFADLVINGDETLDGKRKQIDLPLSSLGSILGSLPERVMEGSIPIPLIELTAEGLAGGGNNNNKNDDGSKKDVTFADSATTGKTKKKSPFKRMFSRKQQHSAAAAAAGGGAAAGRRAASPPRVYDGATPLSIFQLGRPPNAKERTLFLDRYGVDPGGDAVVRIGLEVFPRGSELEKIFRQKNKLRKKAAQVAANAASSATGGKGVGGGRKSPGTPGMGRKRSHTGGFSQSHLSVGSPSHDTTDSRSLMDDEDDYDEDPNLLDEDNDYDTYDSVFSQSFFTLDSDASRTTWDESTMYTDALSSFNTMDEDDSMSCTTGFTEYEKSPGAKSKKGSGAANKNMATVNFLTNFLNCNGPSSVTCGLDQEEEEEDTPRKTPVVPYSNFDLVVDAVASMSMAQSGEESNTPRMAHHHTEKKQSDKSVSSMDTATRANNRGMSPESIKESGEELTLDIINPSPYPTSSSSARSGNGVGSGPPPPLDTSIPFVDRSVTSVTIENETTPLATIKQRFAESQDFDENDNHRRRRGGKVEEGHEFTLEEHQSSM